MNRQTLLIALLIAVVSEAHALWRRQAVLSREKHEVLVPEVATDPEDIRSDAAAEVVSDSDEIKSDAERGVSDSDEIKSDAERGVSDSDNIRSDGAEIASY